MLARPRVIDCVWSWADDQVSWPREVKDLMSDDDEIQRVTEIERVTNGKPSHLKMDDAFCTRMRAAIATGLESAPIGVVTSPGTQNPRYVSDVTARYHRSRDER